MGERWVADAEGIADIFIDNINHASPFYIVAAALLSGDETTFKLFRTQAPELVHLPDATYEWYCRHYLDRYYPVRFILHHQGIEFPRA